MVTKMAVSSLVSFWIGLSFSGGKSSISSSSSTQDVASSSSYKEPSILLMKSPSDFACCDSRYWAPTDVPDRRTCLPNTCASVDFGNAANNRIMRTAKSLVLIFKSLSIVKTPKKKRTKARDSGFFYFILYRFAFIL